MTSYRRSFGQDFDERVRRAPSRIAVISALTERVWTYEALESLTDRLMVFLLRFGWTREKPILSLLPNSVEQFAFFLTVLRYGGHFAPLSPMMRVHEILQMKGILQASFCLLPDHVEPSIGRALEASGISVLRIKTDGTFDCLDVVPARVDRSRLLAARPDCSGTLYVATSGTTSEPKWIVLDGDTLWSAGVAFVNTQRFLDQSVCFYNVLPMSYLGGLFNLGLIPLACGGSIALSESFSGASFLGFWNDIERFKVNVLWLAPTLVRGLLEMRRRLGVAGVKPTCPQIRASFLGMAPIDLNGKEKFELEFGVPLLENYALSETTFLTSETLDSRFRRIESSVGELLPYVDLRFSNNAEVEVRSPFLCRGYLQAGGRVDLPLTEDGYFKTGDLGHIERENLLVLTGRLRDIVKKGGYLVSLTEIECLAARHPSIDEAAAVPVQHDFYGEDFVLFVRLRPEGGSGLALKEHLERFRSWITRELARFKWPSRVIAIEDFPRTSSGKVQKRVLQERLGAHAHFLNSLAI